MSVESENSQNLFSTGLVLRTNLGHVGNVHPYIDRSVVVVVNCNDAAEAQDAVHRQGAD